MSQINLEAVDTDGAIREAADAVAGDTRMSFLRKGAMGGAAALSGGAILSALIPGAAGAKTVGAPPASFGKGDIGILNYALTLEYLESSFYNEAAASGKITNKALKQFLATVQKDENAHVEAAQEARSAPRRPRSRSSTSRGFPRTRPSSPPPPTCWRTPACTPTSARRPTSPTPRCCSTAASIVTVEARHSGAIGAVPGQVDRPGAPRHRLDRRQGPRRGQGHRLHQGLSQTGHGRPAGQQLSPADRQFESGRRDPPARPAPTRRRSPRWRSRRPSWPPARRRRWRCG